jgi:hypothetical protein
MKRMNMIEPDSILMALSTLTAPLTTTAVFFMSSMAASTGYGYKNGKTTTGYDQQYPDDQ